MLLDGIKNEEEEFKNLTFSVLFVQAIATSIDALSVGFTIANYSLFEAIVCTIIITIITFINSLIGFWFGGKFKNMPSRSLEIMAGSVLIVLALKALF